MKLWIPVFALALVACDNNTFSTSPQYSLFETSAGVVYRVDQTSGELEVVSSNQQVVVHTGDTLQDAEGRLFRYLGGGEFEQIDRIGVLPQQDNHQ